MIKEVLNTAESKMQKTISVLSSDLTTLKLEELIQRCLIEFKLKHTVDYVQ